MTECIECGGVSAEGYDVCDDCLDEEYGYEVRNVTPILGFLAGFILAWIIFAALYFIINLLVWKV